MLNHKLKLLGLKVVDVRHYHLGPVEAPSTTKLRKIGTYHIHFRLLLTRLQLLSNTNRKLLHTRVILQRKEARTW
jgi:hypothetical protein